MIEKGTKIKVDPIRKIKDLKSISKYLGSDKGNLRDLLLWTMGTNNGLRAKDLVRIKVCDVCDLKIGEILDIIETKTDKENILKINKSTHKALHEYLNDSDLDNDDYLFKSKTRKGVKKHISSKRVGELVRSWTSEINIKGRFGAHTLRKTWGYHQRKTFDMGYELICERYKHASAKVTQGYLGIEDKEINEMLDNEVV